MVSLEVKPYETHFICNIFFFRNELENLQSKNEELIQKHAQIVQEIQSLQIQHQSVQNDSQLTIQNLEQSLAKERKFKCLAEDECLQKNNVINIVLL